MIFYLYNYFLFDIGIETEYQNNATITSKPISFFFFFCFQASINNLFNYKFIMFNVLYNKVCNVGIIFYIKSIFNF